MKYIILIIATFALLCCNTKKQNQQKSNEQINQVATNQDAPVIGKPQLDIKGANQLAQLPLHCMEQEYPNKLNQVIGTDNDLKSPKQLHPAFYGCFDWHSAVHGHWSLVSLLRQFPELEDRELIKQKLLANISEENIENEVSYFHGEHNTTFERTYGWAWLLKLAEELHLWDDPVARELESNLQPLTDLIVSKYLEFLPKLNYPIRVGEHPNTAFGLSFAYDYALTLKDDELKNLIAQRAKDFYLTDENCPLHWEPSGFDFLSPCLEEAALMKRILPNEAFKMWFSKFLPQLTHSDFQLDVGQVSDRTDGKLVHLDGVNFSRAWSLMKIAENSPEYFHLKQTTYHHINHSLPNIVDDSYEGGHWLGSFAIFALNATSSD